MIFSRLLSKKICSFFFVGILILGTTSVAMAAPASKCRIKTKVERVSSPSTMWGDAWVYKITWKIGEGFRIDDRDSAGYRTWVEYGPMSEELWGGPPVTEGPGFSYDSSSRTASTEIGVPSETSKYYVRVVAQGPIYRTPDSPKGCGTIATKLQKLR